MRWFMEFLSSSLVKGILIGFVLFCVGVATTRPTKKDEKENTSQRFTVQATTRIILAFFGLLAILSVFSMVFLSFLGLSTEIPQEEPAFFGLVVFITAATYVANVFAIFMLMRFKIWVSEKTIRYRPVFGKIREYTFNEIRSVEKKGTASFEQLILRFDQSKCEVSVLNVGYSLLLKRLLEEHVPFQSR